MKLKHLTLLVMAVAGLVGVCGPAGAQQPELKKGRLHTECSHRGIGRVRSYDVTSADIPASFNGLTLAFVTDVHYASRFKERTLRSLSNVLTEIKPDALLLGGDYQEGCEYVEPLFRALMECQPRLGAYAVMGNNDYERCTELIYSQMKDCGITLVEDTVAKLMVGEDHIWVAGAHNTFRGRETTPSPTHGLAEDDFVILLTHTPDYAEDVAIPHADLTLAGHTHGGQVTLFGIWAPLTASHYGQRFRTGLNRNTAGQWVLTSNGLGTSRKAVRLFAKSEIVVLRLHSANE